MINTISIFKRVKRINIKLAAWELVRRDLIDNTVKALYDGNYKEFEKDYREWMNKKTLDKQK